MLHGDCFNHVLYSFTLSEKFISRKFWGLLYQTLEIASTLGRLLRAKPGKALAADLSMVFERAAEAEHGS
jgi:hypothetical protein